MSTEKKASVIILQEFLLLLGKIAIILLIFAAVFTFVFGIFRYENSSMYPMVKAGDLVVYYRHDKDYSASDTLVLKYEGEYQVRRVIAVAGDIVNINEDGLSINGAVQKEDSIYEETVRYDTDIEFPLTVPEGCVFVLGDSRENSVDSRMYGCIKAEETCGKVITLIRRRSV